MSVRKKAPPPYRELSFIERTMATGPQRRPQRVRTPGFIYKPGRGSEFAQLLGVARRVLDDGNCDYAQELGGRLQRLAKKPKEVEASARLQRGLQRCFIKKFGE